MKSLLQGGWEEDVLMVFTGLALVSWGVLIISERTHEKKMCVCCIHCMMVLLGKIVDRFKGNHWFVSKSGTVGGYSILVQKWVTSFGHPISA